MLHIILTILKIIGIIILVLLGIVLTLLLLVLFVPIRYDIDFSKEDKIRARIKAHWLLHFISFKFTYDENGTNQCARVLGIKVFPKKKKDTLPADDVTSTDSKKKHKPKKDNNKESTDSTVTSEKSEVNSSETFNETDVSVKDRENVSEQKEEPKKPKISLIQKFKNKIDEIKAKLKAVIDSIKNIFTNIHEKIDYLVDMIKDDSNKKSIKYLFKCVVKLLKRILPRKHKFYVVYGKDDPAKLADIIGYVSMFKAATNIKLEFVPDFTQDILVAKGKLKGKIEIYYICYLAIKIYKDKDIRKFLKNFAK